MVVGFGLKYLTIFGLLIPITGRQNKLPPVILKERKKMMEARILISFNNGSLNERTLVL